MEDITVILNAYKRPEYLKEQIAAIKAQSVKPKEIWLWINKSDITIEDELVHYGVDINFDVDLVVKSSRNFKYHGRFALGLLAQTKYVAFFDDDTIPGKDWFKNCLETEAEHEALCILGGAGCVLKSDQYVYHERAGWPVPSPEKTLVDLVGHAWFMDRSHLNHLWKHNPPTQENGEDIQLSFEAFRHGSVESVCPPHPKDKPEMWSSLKAWEYGNDDKASSNGSLKPIPQFYKERDELISHYRHWGYIPVALRR